MKMKHALFSSSRYSSSLLACLFVHLLLATASSAQPFGPGDDDAVYSDRHTVHYLVPKENLWGNFCDDDDTLPTLKCNAATHRFCALTKKHATGFGVENETDSMISSSDFASCL